MRTPYAVGVALAAVVAVAIVGVARRGPPRFIWTDGTRICGSPGGPAIVGFHEFRFLSHDGPIDLGQREHLNFLLVDEPPPTPKVPEHWDRVFLEPDISRMDEIVSRVPFLDRLSTMDLVVYDPAHGAPDVIDDNGVAWWRCNLAR